jgi:hypothetical protein
MSVKQLFYTSCKRGLSSGMGFQTYSMSKGITEKERREIEGYCVYIPPDNLPTHPSDEEIDKLFPVAFSSFILESGKYCVCNAQYTGKDYSGRYGNYFCHALISDKPWNFYPIELYGSSIFKSRLTAEEENMLQIDCLPEFEEISLGNIISFDTISSFLKQSSIDKRRKEFMQLMEIAIGYSKDKKRIIFLDYNSNIPFWIGAVQMSLPKKLAEQFSFTTYCYNPEDVNYAICAVDSNGSKFNFKDSQKLYKYNVLNFINHDIDDRSCKSNFVKRAEIGYTVSKEVFLPFRDFINQFEYNVLDENIDNCIMLYNMIKKGVEKSDIENIKRALSFAINYKSMEAYDQIFKQLDSKLEKISSQVDIELAEIITRFLLKAGRQTDNSENVRKAYDFFFDSVHYLIVDAEEVSSEQVLELYKKIKNAEESNMDEFIQLSLEMDRVKAIKTYIEDGKARHAKFYFKTIIDDIITFNDKFSTSNNKKEIFGVKEEKDKDITVFLNKSLRILMTSQEDIVDILNYFKDNCEYFGKIVFQMYTSNKVFNKNLEVEKLLCCFVVGEGDEDKEWKGKIFSEISKLPNCSEFLFSIYIEELRKNNGKKSFFINYCYDIFKLSEEYRNKKFCDALKIYLEVNDSTDISMDEYRKVITYIIKKSLMEYVDNKVIEKLFTYLEENIGIDDAEVESNIIEKIRDIKIKYNIKTPCSIIELLYVGKKIQEPGIVNKAAVLYQLKVDFNNISGGKYSQYLKWFLSNVCVYLKDFKDHIKVEKSLLCLEYSDIYYNIYIDTLEDIIFNKKFKNILKSYNKEGYEILLDFIIMVFKNMEYIEEKTQKIIYDRIINILTKVPEKKIEEYSKYIIDKSKNLKDKVDIMIKWREIIKIVKEKKQKKSLFRFLKKSSQS